jgi:hypothetical protein
MNIFIIPIGLTKKLMIEKVNEAFVLFVNRLYKNRLVKNKYGISLIMREDSS